MRSAAWRQFTTTLFWTAQVVKNRLNWGYWCTCNENNLLGQRSANPNGRALVLISHLISYPSAQVYLSLLSCCAVSSSAVSHLLSSNLCQWCLCPFKVGLPHQYTATQFYLKSTIPAGGVCVHSPCLRLVDSCFRLDATLENWVNLLRTATMCKWLGQDRKRRWSVFFGDTAHPVIYYYA